MWIKTKAEFNEDPDSEYSKPYWGDFIFNTNDLKSFNRGSNDLTTMDLSDNVRIRVAISFDDMINLVDIEKVMIAPKVAYEVGENVTN